MNWPDVVGALTQRFGWPPDAALDLDDLELEWWSARAEELARQEEEAAASRG